LLALLRSHTILLLSCSCTTLATTLVDWATQFPRIVEEQLRENNQLLKTLDSQLEKLDTLVDKLDHTF